MDVFRLIWVIWGSSSAPLKAYYAPRLGLQILGAGLLSRGKRSFMAETLATQKKAVALELCSMKKHVFQRKDDSAWTTVLVRLCFLLTMK